MVVCVKIETCEEGGSMETCRSTEVRCCRNIDLTQESQVSQECRILTILLDCCSFDRLVLEIEHDVELTCSFVYARSRLSL